MDDQTLLQTVQNSLMIAGHEMGPVGDHWPAIHALARGVKKELEEIQRDEAVVGELEFYLAEAFREVEEVAEETCTPEQLAYVKGHMKALWDHYYAALEPIAPSVAPRMDDLQDEAAPKFKNMLAAAKILRNLERVGGVL